MELEKYLRTANFDVFEQELVKMKNNVDLRTILLDLCSEYGVVVPFCLMRVAFSTNDAYWYNETGFCWVFGLNHVDGSEECAFLMFKRSIEINGEDLFILNALLDYYYPPVVLLSSEYASKIAKTILRLSPNDIRARKVLHG